MPQIHESKLRTDFICIATSGYSVDGRIITSQELHEMAETYDPDFYTANMWPDHRRWLNFGQVLEVKAEDQANGETKLFAILSPSRHLVSWNQEGQYLFTSIEIAPNFRNSGKCYLFGLGVTDTPASVGTTQLNFSLNKIEDGTFFGENVQVEMKFKEFNQQQKEERSFFEYVRSFFLPESEKIPQNNNNKEEDSMNKEQIEKFTTALNQVGEKLDKLFSLSPQPQKEPVVETPPENNTSTEIPKSEFNTLVQSVDTLSKKVEVLSEKFTALSQEATPVPNGVPAVVEEDGHYSVDGYKINVGEF